MLKTFFTQRALKGKFGTHSKDTRGHSKVSPRASQGTWALGDSKGTFELGHFGTCTLKPSEDY